MNTLPKHLTLSDISQYLRLSERSLQKMAENGELPGVMLNGSWQIERDDFMRWLDYQRRSQRSSVSTVGISALFSPERVLMLDVKTKEEALNAMVDCLAKSSVVIDRDRLSYEIFQRESLMSTGIGLGIAVPHTRSDNIRDLAVCAALSSYPLADYESIDDEPVRILFMIVARTDQHSLHLKALSALSHHVKNGDCLRRILSSQSASDFYNALVL